MKTVLHTLGRSVEIRGRVDGSAGPEPYVAGSPSVSRARLGALATDWYNGMALRHLLAGAYTRPVVHRMTDHEVLDEVARQLADGLLTVEEKPHRYAIVGGGTGDTRQGAEAPAPEAPAEPLQAAPAARPAGDAQPVIGGHVDAAAQAAALREAAASGTPFCEECEKARREQEARGMAA